MPPLKERRDGKDRRDGKKGSGSVRGWLAVLGTVVGTGGGIQLGQQHAEANMTQDSAKMLMHTRDREVDTLRSDNDKKFAGLDHRMERLEDRVLKCFN